MSDDRIEVKIIGFTIGTASGWDDMGINIIFFYDFEPNPGFNISGDGLNIDFNTGVISAYDNEGNEAGTFDAFTIVNNGGSING